MDAKNLHSRIIFTLLFASISCFSFAQKSQKKANKLFDLNAYELAIENYELALKQDPNCTECLFKLAECYRMLNENIDAAICYRKLDSGQSPDDSFYKNYGNVMKKMGQYDKAQELYIKYAEVNPMESEMLVNGVVEAKKLLSKPSEYEIALYLASSRQSDFAPAVINSQVVFSSFRNDIKREVEKENKSLIISDKPELFVSKKSTLGNAKNSSFLLSDLEDQDDVVGVNYAQAAPLCALTVSESLHPSMSFNENDNHLSIYTASADERGNYFDMVAFPYNEVGYSTGFPTLNPAGNIMYFASNRPAGLGGYDLYVSYFKDGSWTYPENLGPNINTPGNEITPFFDGEELFFASDMQAGLGGYDLFRSKVIDGSWILPTNLGNGVNSPEDDLYCIKDTYTNEIYVSSNRLGGRGSLDIYILSEKETIQPVEEILAMEIAPAAVKLDDLVANNSSIEDSNVKVVSQKEIVEHVKKTEELEEEFDPENPPAAVVLEDNKKEVNVSSSKFTVRAGASNVSLVSAKKVSFGNVIVSNTPVYFIQLAAIFNTKGNVDEYKRLVDLGSLYKIYESSSTKIKLGYFYDEYQAKSVLDQVRSMGYKDAFITYAPLNTSNMELFASLGNTFDLNETSNAGLSSKTYKVRLASYEDPSWFDVKSVSDIGTIEQWSKGGWTIFVLSGFSNFENAETAKIKALNRGYADAEVVIDNAGVLQSLDKN